MAASWPRCHKSLWNNTGSAALPWQLHWNLCKQELLQKAVCSSSVEKVVWGIHTVTSCVGTLKGSLVLGFTVCSYLRTSLPGNGHRDITLPLENVSTRWFRKHSMWLCQQRQRISWCLPLRKGKVMMISYSVGSERAKYYSDQWSFPFYIPLRNILCLNSLWAETREGDRVSTWSPQPSTCHTICTFHEFQPMELDRNNALFKKIIIALQNFLFSSLRSFLFCPSPLPLF